MVVSQAPMNIKHCMRWRCDSTFAPVPLQGSTADEPPALRRVEHRCGNQIEVTAMRKCVGDRMEDCSRDSIKIRFNRIHGCNTVSDTRTAIYLRVRLRKRPERPEPRRSIVKGRLGFNERTRGPAHEVDVQCDICIMIQARKLGCRIRKMGRDEPL
ncbi:hypothetical protein K474DRAFT_288777 [Panus rudis PR-1116 ss-1]|nr:hypothetical protein K474DRAFT_288777 [Panus rudis PR-1116 ss-1]